MNRLRQFNEGCDTCKGGVCDPNVDSEMKKPNKFKKRIAKEGCSKNKGKMAKEMCSRAKSKKDKVIKESIDPRKFDLLIENVNDLLSHNLDGWIVNRLQNVKDFIKQVKIYTEADTRNRLYSEMQGIDKETEDQVKQDEDELPTDPDLEREQQRTVNKRKEKQKHLQRKFDTDINDIRKNMSKQDS